jgi:hypothetical protein
VGVCALRILVDTGRIGAEFSEEESVIVSSAGEKLM